MLIKSSPFTEFLVFRGSPRFKQLKKLSKKAHFPKLFALRIKSTLFSLPSLLFQRNVFPNITCLNIDGFQENYFQKNDLVAREMNQILKNCAQLMAIRIRIYKMKKLPHPSIFTNRSFSREHFGEKYEDFDADKASKMKFEVIKMPKKIKWIYLDFLELNVIFDLSDCENILGLEIPTS